MVRLVCQGADRRGAHLTGKRARVWAKTGGRCGYCGRVLNPNAWHMDHVVPRKLGGSEDVTNLIPSCIQDNLSKGSQTLEEFRMAVEHREARAWSPLLRLVRRRHRFYFERRPGRS